MAHEKYSRRILSHLRPKALRQLCMVCDRLNQIASPVAYRHITLDQSYHFVDLIETLESHLAYGCVLSFPRSSSSSSSPTSTSDTDLDEQQRTVLRLIYALSHTTSLTVRLNPPYFDDAGSDFERRSATPSSPVHDDAMDTVERFEGAVGGEHDDTSNSVEVYPDNIASRGAFETEIVWPQFPTQDREIQSTVITTGSESVAVPEHGEPPFLQVFSGQIRRLFYLLSKINEQHHHWQQINRSDQMQDDSKPTRDINPFPLMPFSICKELIIDPIGYPAFGRSFSQLHPPFPALSHLSLHFLVNPDLFYVWEANMNELAMYIPHVRELSLMYSELSSIEGEYCTYLSYLPRFMGLHTVHLYLEKNYTGRVQTRGYHFGDLWGHYDLEKVAWQLIQASIRRVPRMGLRRRGPKYGALFRELVVHLPSIEDVQWVTALPALLEDLHDRQEVRYGQVLINVNAEHLEGHTEVLGQARRGSPRYL